MVSVSGSGYTPGSTVSLAQCNLRNGQVGGICNAATFTAAKADSSGRFTTSMVVRRVISQSASTADCAATTTACGIAASGNAEQAVVVAALTFDPSVPPVRTVLDVRPAADLHDGESVQVRGVGFTPDADVVVAQCPMGTFALEACDISGRTAARTDSTGTFVVSFVVHAVIIPTGPGGEPEPQTPIDCRDSSCRITAANKVGASEHADEAITFVSTSVAQPAELPKTGGASRALSLVGGTLVFLGLGVLVASRPRKPRRRRQPG